MVNMGDSLQSRVTNPPFSPLLALHVTLTCRHVSKKRTLAILAHENLLLV